MSLGQISSIRFTEITETPAVQERIKLVSEVISDTVGGCSPISPAHLLAAEVAPLLDAEARLRPHISFASSGDISTLMFGTRGCTFIGFDRLPFINEGITNHLVRNDWSGDSFVWTEGTPFTLLKLVVDSRNNLGFIHNDFTAQFAEVGVFMFLDILGLGGDNIGVFQAEGQQGLYRINFNFGTEKYEVYLVEEMLDVGQMPRMLEGVMPGSIWLKGGAKPGDASPYIRGRSYQMLYSIAERFPQGTLIVTDQKLLELEPAEESDRKLEAVAFNFDPQLADYPFGYQMGGPYLYRVK